MKRQTKLALTSVAIALAVFGAVRTGLNWVAWIAFGLALAALASVIITWRND